LQVSPDVLASKRGFAVQRQDMPPTIRHFRGMKSRSATSMVPNDQQYVHRVSVVVLPKAEGNISVRRFPVRISRPMGGSLPHENGYVIKERSGQKIKNTGGRP
jgi:hypothetical protein